MAKEPIIKIMETCEQLEKAQKHLEELSTDKQIDKLHDALSEIIDPEGYGWINKSTEVVIDDLIMGGVSIDEFKTRFEVERAIKRELGIKLDKAEHDRDRYARKNAELTEENERLKDSLVNAYKTIEEQVDESYEYGKTDTVQVIQDKFALHFGTYTDKDTVKVVDVFKLISQFTNEVLENE